MRIGEVAERAGVPAKTIRFWEDRCLLPLPDRTPAGYREYGPDILERLAFIRRSQTAGLTLEQIRQVLQIRDSGQAPCVQPGSGQAKRAPRGKPRPMSRVPRSLLKSTETTCQGGTRPSAAPNTDSKPGSSTYPPSDWPTPGRQSYVDPSARRPTNPHESARSR